MTDIRKRVVFKDVKGETLAAQSVKLSSFKSSSIDAADALFGRDVRTLQAVRTRGTAKVRVNASLELDGIQFKVVNVEPDGRMLNMTIEASQ